MAETAMVAERYKDAQMAICAHSIAINQLEFENSKERKGGEYYVRYLERNKELHEKLAELQEADATTLFADTLAKNRQDDAKSIEISEKALAIGIGSCTPEEIDALNIKQATRKAMLQAVQNLELQPGIVLVDAETINGLDIRQVPIIKGDAKSVSIAAASIIAKVTRDHLMEEYDKIYPQYGFASNKGYGSAAHMEALRQFGPCPIHRRSFIKNILSNQ